MLDAFTSKFGSLKYIFPKLKNQLAKQELSKDHFIHTEDLVDIDNILPIKTSALADSNTVDVIKGKYHLRVFEILSREQITSFFSKR